MYSLHNAAKFIKRAAQVFYITSSAVYHRTKFRLTLECVMHEETDLVELRTVHYTTVYYSNFFVDKAGIQPGW